MVRLYKILALTSLSLFFIMKSAHATSISPVLVENEIAPGGSVSGVINLGNDVETPGDFSIIYQRFIVEDESGAPTFISQDAANEVPDLKDWIKTDKETYFVEQGKTVKVGYTINVPPDAEPGGHYAVMFFTLTPTGQVGGSGVGITSKTGVLFLVNVSGNIKVEANLENFDVEDNYNEHLPINFYLRIKNTGTTHIRPFGDIVIKNIFGGITSRINVNPKNNAALPNSIRRIDSQWLKSESYLNTGFFGSVINEWNNFAIGRYTATLDATYGKDAKPLEAKTVSFWVFPWHLLLTILLIIVIILLGVKTYNSLIINSAMKKHGKK